MTSTSSHGSARIYQFPVKPRAIVQDRRESAKRLADVKAGELPNIQWGSGWYHEEAIRDAQRGLKR